MCEERLLHTAPVQGIGSHTVLLLIRLSDMLVTAPDPHNGYTRVVAAKLVWLAEVQTFAFSPSIQLTPPCLACCAPCRMTSHQDMSDVRLSVCRPMMASCCTCCLVRASPSRFPFTTSLQRR